MDRPALAPSTALGAIALGHTAWGLVAYRDQVAGILRELPGSVGDGIFDQEHSRDARAAAYWFLAAGPVLGVTARLCRSAEDAGDREALRTAGAAITALCVSGLVTIPRSGFPGGIAIGLWMLRRARR